MKIRGNGLSGGVDEVLMYVLVDDSKKKIKKSEDIEVCDVLIKLNFIQLFLQWLVRGRLRRRRGLSPVSRDRGDRLSVRLVHRYVRQPRAVDRLSLLQVSRRACRRAGHCRA
jgi:hypothetical protein